MRKHCGMSRHQSNGYSKARSLIHRAKCNYSVQRIGTNTNNLTASKHVTSKHKTGLLCIFVPSPASLIKIVNLGLFSLGFVIVHIFSFHVWPFAAILQVS